MVPATAPAARMPRAVPLGHVAAWYAEALAIFRRSPGRFMLLALATLACELLLGLIPVAGAPLANMLVPLVASGLLYASLAADEGEPVRLRFAVLAFGARAGAVAAVILASLVTFAAQVATAAWLDGVNLLAPSEAPGMRPGVIAAVYAAGILASLPVTFVPFAALFDGEGVRPSFQASLAASRQNALPLLVYGLASFGLALVGLATYGIALLVALPLWAASSYAAWKDVFGVRSPRDRSSG